MTESVEDDQSSASKTSSSSSLARPRTSSSSVPQPPLRSVEQNKGALEVNVSNKSN